MYTRTKMCCARAVECPESGQVVPAGEACRGLCGDMDMISGASLPNVMIQEQTYTTGFCPCEALEHGTLFPELLG